MDEVNHAMAGSAGAAYSAGKVGAGFGWIAAGFASIMAMVLLEPQGPKEKAVCFVSTFICAACLSSAIKLYFGITFPDTADGMLANTGLIIASGSPGWVLVRAYVLTAHKTRGKTLIDLWKLIRGLK